jgi:hypothetical protein
MLRRDLILFMDSADNLGKEQEDPTADWPGILQLSESYHAKLELHRSQLLKNCIFGLKIYCLHAHCGEQARDDVDRAVLDGIGG